MLRLACILAALQLALGAEYLLPGDVKPFHYDLSLLYDIDPATNYSFFGNVDILLQAKKPTSKIVLHAKDFEISEDKASLTSGGDSIDLLKVQLNDTFNLLTVDLTQPLEVGRNYTLTLPFYGNLASSLDGAYISTYVDKKNGAKEHLVTTQFEAISARKAFPCFDEPIYKASFQVTIGHHRDYNAIANMPAFNSSDRNDLEDQWPWSTVVKKFKKPEDRFVWDRFSVSVPMSTYLVAWVVSKFEHVESPPELSTTKFRIWARRDAIDQTEYASTVGPKVLTHFEKWFGVPFPLPKQDMVAIPDFAAGAMENWGLITYRETALLYDKEESSFLSKERVAEVIAHELAHQWFGNLVTMKWWSDLWLNEGFATFVASLGVAAVEPEWRAERAYAVDNIMSVLGLDALKSSHPVSVPIDDPKRISEIFDEISYRKGSALIRMMTMFLGDDVFRKAINNYLIKYSYHNAEQDDLWQELTAVNQETGGLSRNVSVKTIMDTWTKQTGYPLISVTRDYSDKTLSITQKRYLAVGEVPTDTSPGPSWWVPLNVLCQNEVGQTPEPVQWLAAHEGLQAGHRFKHGSEPGEWVLFNAEMIAPYRVNYDADNWRLLAKTVNSDQYSTIPVLSRVQLLSDSLELAWTNILDYEHALRMVKYLNRETDYLPLSTGLRGLAKIENVIKRSPEFGAYQKFMRGLIAETYERAGGLARKSIVNGDQLNSVKMQVLTSQWACRMKVPGCEENAIELFRTWMASDTPDEDNPVPLDLRRTVYCVAISRGSVVEWRFLLERKRRSNVASHSDAILHALACTREIWILNQYLEWAVTEGSEVRRQDAVGVISAVTRSTVGFYVAKEFIYNRIEDIHRTFNGNSRIGRIMKNLLEQFTTQKELDEFQQWQAKNSKLLEGSKLALDQGLEKARVNIDWIQRNKDKVVGLMRQTAMDENLLLWWQNFYKNSGSAEAIVTRTVIMCIITTLLL